MRVCVYVCCERESVCVCVDVCVCDRAAVSEGLVSVVYTCVCVCVY